MTFIEILDTIFLEPLKTTFEIFFSIAYSVSGNVGASIIILSLVINFLVLPLYNSADAMQEKTRKKEASLEEGISHIKKTFSGDEKIMILQTYYKQNNYSPISALSGSISLLLEIPFFMAAYQFLSKLSLLEGASLGPIANLAKPDELIKIGNFTINVLPFLMTIINLISSYLYLKDAPLKSKIQLYVMALFFLVFLYTSPAGLVFYWTLNNVFSLGKTIILKFKEPKKALIIFSSITGFIFIILSLFKIKTLEVGIILQLPILASIIKIRYLSQIKLFNKIKEEKDVRYNRKQFIMASILITLFIGVFIPSTYVAASPQEYIYANIFYNPLLYVLNSFLISVGFFMVWLQVFYWLASEKGKAKFDKIIYILCVIMIVDYMFFGLNLGNISSTLKYDKDLNFSVIETLVNISVVIVISVVIKYVYRNWKNIISIGLSFILVIITCVSTFNVIKSISPINDYKKNISAQSNKNINFSLSITGKNVIVIMLDRALGQFIPYLFNEKPELYKKFDGFTYYSNTISFGKFTNIAAPALLGGYEYTPVELNKRDTESLKDKNNEANMVMPLIFSNEGYKVTVSDPIYINYDWSSDLSYYEQYPEINAFNAAGKFVDNQQIKYSYESNTTNFFRFSFMKTLPLLLQSFVYNNAKYNNIKSIDETEGYDNQNISNISKAEGLHSVFMANYLTLVNMNTMTKVTSDDINTFLFIKNDLTHEPILLDEANGYIPSFNVDNTEYDEEHKDRFTLNGKVLNIDNPYKMKHYQSNMSALLRLANWLDYLRETGVYDNTRIIITSDHSENLRTISNWSYLNNGLESYAPLLMVKDFEEKGFKTSNEFMTNADIVTLATQNLGFVAKNPFTGKNISMEEKFSHKQFISTTDSYSIYKNNGNSFLPSTWLSFDSTKPNCNIYDLECWDYLEDNIVLKEHYF